MSGDPVRGAYRGAAGSWAADAALAYVPLARHLVDLLDGRLPGPHALDAGAGTGAAGDALRELGARVVSTDLETDMLGHQRADRGPAVAADVARLPFRSAGFDVVTAAFVLNHVSDQRAVLAELGRVTRPGGVVLASVFGNERSAAKEAVDGCLLDAGWSPPGWYDAVRQRAEAIGTVDLLQSAAEDAGLAATVHCTEVDVGLDAPELVVRYRLGVAHCSGFVASLSAGERDRLIGTATAAVAATGEPFRPEVLELVATVS